MASALSTTFAARPSLPTDEMATVAHEMRTPLTAMKASLALLMEQHVSAEAQQELLTTCRQTPSTCSRLSTTFLSSPALRTLRHLRLNRWRLPRSRMRR